MRRMAHVVLAAVLAMATTVSASPEAGVQPLSKIAIHKATVHLDLHRSSAYVRATPAVLGGQVCKANCLAIFFLEYARACILYIKEERQRVPPP